MNDSLSTISSTPDFVPVSFNSSIGVHTFVNGYWLVIVVLFVYSRFKDDYALALKIVNVAYLLSVSWSIILILKEVYDAFYARGIEYHSYVLVGGIPLTVIGLICTMSAFGLFIKKIRTSINYSLILGSISLLPLVAYACIVFFWNNDYLPLSIRDLYPKIFDKLEAGLVFLTILLVMLLIIKIYKTLKLRLSPHK